ncbi:hypothetical protein [Lysinibacillus sp. FSL M8-0134]|uniref:hypothetical protein n=1 Tax=Lysinibacillus sp. FSL M8-0134 TaxID=2921717 RepID=UPI003119E65C
MRLLLTEEELKNLIVADDWMMDILSTVETLQLPDWWVCAGVIRRYGMSFMKKKIEHRLLILM